MQNEKVLEIGEPSEKQKAFFLADERFIAYGGARGGGKSWAVRKKSELLGLNYAGCKILFLRRTLKELRENHMDELGRDLDGIANFREVDSKYTFANGSTLKLGYCDSEKDVNIYQGQEYDFIFLDEATQFTEYQYTVLTACLRGANAYPKRMYLTCNPGGVGHAWVKRLFIDREYRESERPEDYRFIAARVEDNRHLVEHDPGYIRMLESLPPDLRRQWLEGEWDVFEGQYFPEFCRGNHVEPDFVPPESWPRYFAMDYGLDCWAAYLAAVAPDGTVHIYREGYASSLLIAEAARASKALAAGQRIRSWYAPPDMWNRRQDTGNSVADIFAQEGVHLQRVSNDRATGWMVLKGYLTPPKLKICESCRNLIKSMPLLLADRKNIGDVASEPHEYTHGPDAIRYLLAGKPRAEAPETEAGRQRKEKSKQLQAYMNYGR